MKNLVMQVIESELRKREVIKVHIRYLPECLALVCQQKALLVKADERGQLLQRS